MLVTLACVVALVCAAASLRRLSFALAPTALDPKMLSDAIAKGQPSLDLVERAVSRVEGKSAGWERNLVGAMRKPRELRIGEVNELLLELDQLASRWARVPRVCASVATSFAFLLGSLALRDGLLDPEPEHMERLLLRALNVVAVGVAGAVVCGLVHFRSREAAKSRLVIVDGLVERLEKLVPEPET